MDTELLAEKEVKENSKYLSPGNTLKWLWLATIASAFFGPLLALSNYPGIFAYKILFIAHLVAFIFFLIVKKIEIKLLPHLKPYFLFFVVWLGWALFSLLWSDNKMDGVRNIWYLFSGLSLASFSAIYFRTDRDLKALLCILVPVFFSVLAVGLWENGTGLHLKTAGALLDLTTTSKMMPRGFFKNPNDLATYLVLYLPVLYTAAKYCCRKLATASLLIILLPAIGTGVYLILQTGSRANMVALVLMAGAAVVLSLIQYKWKALRNMTLLSIALVLVYCILAFSVPAFANWGNRQYRTAYHHISSLKYAGTQESARVILLRNSIAELKEHAFLGVGAGNAEEHMKKYRNDSYLLLALHNWWLEIFVNYGFFVFILYLTFYIKLLYELFVVAVRAGPGLVRVLGESSLFALVGFPIAALSSSSLIYSRFMWILFGIALCVINIYQVNRPSGEEDCSL